MMNNMEITEKILNLESGALPGKMVLVRIIKNNKINAYHKVKNGQVDVSFVKHS